MKRKATGGKTRQGEDTARGSLSGTPYGQLLVWLVLAGGGALAVWAMALGAGQADEVRIRAAEGWGQYAQVIVDNKIRALWHGALMTLGAGAALWMMLSGRTAAWRRLVAWGLVLAVAIDAILLAPHYVKSMPMSALAENPVVTLLRKDMPEHRAALVSQEGFYNWWLTYLFPYYDIKTLNVTQMPRMPADYKAFLGAVGKNPIRLWQLSAIGHVLAPAQSWAQMQKDPQWKSAFELVYSYDVQPAEMGVRVIPASPQVPGQHVVLRLVLPAPRYALAGAYEVREDDAALKDLASTRFPLFEKVLVAPGESRNWPELSRLGADAPAGVAGTCRLLAYRAGRVELDIEAARPAILRITDRFDADWKASVDRQPAGVHRVDYLFQGVVVPAGRHRVLLTYSPSAWPLWGQAAGMLACMGAAAWLLIGRFKGTPSA